MTETTEPTMPQPNTTAPSWDDPRHTEGLRMIAAEGGELTIHAEDDLERQCVIAECHLLNKMGLATSMELGPDDIRITLTNAGWKAINDAE